MHGRSVEVSEAMSLTDQIADRVPVRDWGRVTGGNQSDPQL